MIKISYTGLAVSTIGYCLPKFFIDEPKVAVLLTFNFICFCLTLAAISHIFPEKE